LSGGGRSGRGGLAGAAALLMLTGAALAASATAGEPSRAPSPVAGESTPETAEARARELTPLVAERIERIRGLSFKHVPVPEVVTAEEFAAISAHAAKLGPRARRELGDAEAVARLLGLMNADEQLDALATGASDLAAAAYDTERERLYVIHDASGDEPAMLEFLLAHELTHALEDQRFGFPELDAATDDEALAGIALIEGSATAVMIEYAARHLDPFELSAASAGLEAGTGGVAAFYVETLTWAYLRGAEFVAGLLGNDVRDWARVDRAFDGHPPLSTEQVLHPALYRANERPIEVGGDIGSVGGGWSVVARGEIGEYTTAQLLRLGAPDAVASQAAAGWGGDRYALASRDAGGTDCATQCRSQRLLAIEWEWDTPAQERGFVATLPAYVVGGLEASPAGGGVWELEGGWAAVSSGPANTRLALAPTRALAVAAAG
jgi:hypothetical protein